MSVRVIKNINDAKKLLDERRPEYRDRPDRQEMAFDHCDLSLLFDFIVNKLESLEDENKRKERCIDSLASQTGRRLDLIEKGNIK